MECFVIIVNSWKPLTIITKHYILDVAAALDPPLVATVKTRYFLNVISIIYILENQVSLYSNGDHVLQIWGCQTGQTVTCFHSLFLSFRHLLNYKIKTFLCLAFYMQWTFQNFFQFIQKKNLIPFLWQICGALIYTKSDFHALNITFRMFLGVFFALFGVFLLMLFRCSFVSCFSKETRIFPRYSSEEYLEPCQTSMIKLLARIGKS